MDYTSTDEHQRMPNEKAQIESFCQQIKDFAPSELTASWSPESGGDMVIALNKLSETLQKKAAEIKQFVRSLTVEELNDLDGFDRGPHIGDEVPPSRH